MKTKQFFFYIAIMAIIVMLLSSFPTLEGAVVPPPPIPANTMNPTDPSYMIVNAGSNSILNQPTWFIEGIEATLFPSDTAVPHTENGNEFFYEYIRIYQGSSSIMIGWSECAWQPDRAIVTEYDTNPNDWVFFPQYTLDVFDSASSRSPSYGFKITHQGNGVWQAWISLDNSVTWQLLVSVQLGFEPSSQTYAEIGMSEYSPAQDWFDIPQTGIQSFTIPSSPGIGGAGIHSFNPAYKNHNPPPIYRLGIGDYNNMIHLSTVALPSPTPTPSPTPSPTSTVTPSPTSTATPTATATPTTTPIPTATQSPTPEATPAITQAPISTPEPTASATPITTPSDPATPPPTTPSPTPELSASTAPTTMPTENPMPSATIAPATSSPTPALTSPPAPTPTPTAMTPTQTPTPYAEPSPTPSSTASPEVLANATPEGETIPEIPVASVGILVVITVATIVVLALGRQRALKARAP